MIYAQLPPEIAGATQRLPFYLAMEEHLARNFDGEYFTMWQVEPTVIFGRNQDPGAEVNISYCRENGINFYRRKSGGGCVYADINNIMTAVITSSTAVEATFARYCRTLADTLRKLGLDAEASGRNDILIGGRKVSGNSFLRLPGRSVIHGTLLYDTDPCRMEHALTPSAAKLGAKGVNSVRSHVTTIREHLPELSIGEFRAFLRENLSDSTMTLTTDDVEEIRRIEAPYYSPEWIFSGHTVARSRRGKTAGSVRIEGAGEFTAEVTRRPGGTIAAVNLSGDFFPLADIDASLLSRLRGAKLSPEGIRTALQGVDVSSVIAGLSEQQLINLLIPANSPETDHAGSQTPAKDS